MRRRFCFSLVWLWSILGATLATNSLPRSQHTIRSPKQTWHPSEHIDPQGFLTQHYQRIPGEWEEEAKLRTRVDLVAPCRIRQVPGDGSCLFHSISLCLCQAVNGTHWDLSTTSSTTTTSRQKTPYSLNGGGLLSSALRGRVATNNNHNKILPPPTLPELYAHSQHLRQQAVDVLRDGRRKLYLQGREYLKSSELVQAAASQYNMDAESYCSSMQHDRVWGGGPEIVALVNVLKRPIHVYELHAHTEQNCQQKFVLRRLACFGSPKFDRLPALHILSADSRFPDLRPGQQQLEGNHFLSVFPIMSRRLRAGSVGNDGEYSRPPWHQPRGFFLRCQEAYRAAVETMANVL